MTKDIDQFPLLGAHKLISITQNIIKVSNEGITEMEVVLEELRSDLNSAILESEQDQILNDVVAAELHLVTCLVSKDMAYSQLKQVDFILN
jgi:hypothetical protein